LMMDYLYSSLLLLSGALIIIAFYQYNITQDLIKNGVRTKANVIKLIEVNDDDGYQYKPVFEYSNMDNELVTFESPVSSRPAPFYVGEKVEIVYSTQDDQVKVISFWGLYRWPLILLSIASPLLIIGGGYLLYSK